MAEKKWYGNTTCDMCTLHGVQNASIKGKTLFDTPVYGGSWMTLCRNCYNTYSTKTCGQEYHKDENGEWIKFKDIGKKEKSIFDMSDSELTAAVGMEL